jgi:hypothetical protein
MKRLLIALALVSLLPFASFAGDELEPGVSGLPSIVKMGAVFEYYSYNNIATATDTQVKGSAGILAGIVVNGGTMGAITVYNNTSCATTTIATIASPYAGQVIPLGVYAGTGICVTTAGATNLTVIYK